MSKRAALAEENDYSMEISQDNELNIGGHSGD